MPVKICNVASVCCQEAEFCYEALNMFYWSLNLLQQNLCLSDRLLNYWLASSWTLCCWSQPFQLNSPTSFQPTPPPSYLAHTSSACQWKCHGRECWKLKPLPKVRQTTSTALHTSTELVILSGYDIDQEWFPVSKSMLIISNNHHVLQKFRNGFQSYVFHPLPWDRGEANQPIVLWILLLGLPAVKSDLSFF